jgi:hypothetical protein
MSFKTVSLTSILIISQSPDALSARDPLYKEKRGVEEESAVRALGSGIIGVSQKTTLTHKAICEAESTTEEKRFIFMV